MAEGQLNETTAENMEIERRSLELERGVHQERLRREEMGRAGIPRTGCELIEERWKKVIGDKLPDATELPAETPGMGSWEINIDHEYAVAQRESAAGKSPHTR
jgi:hypothetical protein